MLVANSFDLWQKDAFFSAAEEVQESADIMESAYRTWARQRREGLTPQDLNELFRELQTALGTAKWQLDEFERAVRLSYRYRADDITTNRHRQFVSAIENQISRVETAVNKSFSEDGKQPLRWVNLDEEERDELAMFLSGTSETSERTADKYSKLGSSTKSSNSEKRYTEQNLNLCMNVTSDRDVLKQTMGCTHVVGSNTDANYVVELEDSGSPGTSDDSFCQADSKIGTRRTWSSPDAGALKITIDSKDEEEKELMSSIEPTPKEKGSKPGFWKLRCGDHSSVKGGFLCQTQLRWSNGINQFFRMVGGNQRQLQSSHFQRRCSVQLTLALMITVFLFVPFVLYST